MEDWNSEGTYELYLISLSDTAFISNYIYYKISGRTEYHDKTFDTTLNGKHDFDFSDIEFSFSKSAVVQTDWTTPELVSFDFSNFTGTSLNKGERVNLVYSASDVDSDLGQVRFEFRNENGNTITLYDNDDDGIASVRMEDWYNEGSYELHRISVRTQPAPTIE